MPNFFLSFSVSSIRSTEDILLHGQDKNKFAQINNTICSVKLSLFLYNHSTTYSAELVHKSPNVIFLLYFSNLRISNTIVYTSMLPMAIEADDNRIASIEYDD